MGENLSSNPELQNAHQRFVDEIALKAPEYREGRPVTFTEDARMQRVGYEPYYSCTITPEDNTSLPPRVMLFHGASAISHERQIFKYNTQDGQYWITHIEAEPVMETVPPKEYSQKPRPATALELGKALGVLEFLTVKSTPNDEISFERHARILGRIARSLTAR